MIVLQNSILPLSTDFFTDKKNLFFKTLTFEGSNQTIFLQNTDFHRVEITSKDPFPPKCRVLGGGGMLNMEKKDPFFKKKMRISRQKQTLFFKIADMPTLKKQTLSP